MTNPNPSPELLQRARLTLADARIAAGSLIGDCPDDVAVSAMLSFAALSQTPPAPSLSTDVQSAAAVFHEQDVSLKVALPAPGEVERREDNDFAWRVPRHATKAMMQAGLYHCTADMQWADLFTAWHYMVDAADDADQVESGGPDGYATDGQVGASAFPKLTLATVAAANDEGVAEQAAQFADGLAEGAQSLDDLAVRDSDSVGKLVHGEAIRVAKHIAAAIRLLPQKARREGWTEKGREWLDTGAPLATSRSQHEGAE
jgi:hypothetical protein